MAIEEKKMSDASVLLELAETDYSILRIKKQLDELPQRARLLELRAKKSEIDAKAEQVAQMRRESENTIKTMQDETDTLKDKIVKAKEKTNKAANYKEVLALNKEIDSHAKRLEKTEFDLLRQMEKLERIMHVEKQVGEALSRLKKQDDELLAVYQGEAGILKREIQAAQELRSSLAVKLPGILLTRYERACKARGGRGAAHIERTHCSGCHVELTEGQLEKLANSPSRIGECPYCHRLLVVKA